MDGAYQLTRISVGGVSEEQDVSDPDLICCLSRAKRGNI
jgi:hypothetical protein